MKFTLDKAKAIGADNKSAWINETGKYELIIEQAQIAKKASGAIMLELVMLDDTERKARTSLCLYQKDGSENKNGAGTMNAMLACLRMREVNSVHQRIEVWDTTARQNVMVMAECLDIAGRKIGLLLQKVSGTYEGKTTSKLEIYGVFEAGTDLTASEILSGITSPEKLSRMVATLADKQEKKHTTQQAQYTHQSQSQGQNNGGFDDDIPF